MPLSSIFDKDVLRYLSIKLWDRFGIFLFGSIMKWFWRVFLIVTVGYIMLFAGTPYKVSEQGKQIKDNTVKIKEHDSTLKCKINECDFKRKMDEFTARQQRIDDKTDILFYIQVGKTYNDFLKEIKKDTTVLKR